MQSRQLKIRHRDIDLTFLQNIFESRKKDKKKGRIFVSENVAQLHFAPETSAPVAPSWNGTAVTQ